MTISEIIKTAEEKVNNVVNGSASQYFKFEHPETEETWTIRVSNHNANPNRCDDNTLSFVVFVPESESEESYSAMTINKKKFKSIPNQFFLNENGEFEENFMDMEECIEYSIF
ncbi:MAG: hypothetical protein MUE81_22610 [Thermoflexibacter sp.]|jgi:hypothetical protein|nr:hypothetical protein [Thermoflexibacter sp.]